MYPSTNFPGRTQEAILGQLLRKKYEPQVENWVEQGRSETTEGKEKDVEDLWNWASDWIGSRAAKYVLEDAGDNYTSEEREAGIENVRTGVRRKLDENESDDEDEDEEMEDVDIDASSAEKTALTLGDSGSREVKNIPVGTKRTLDEILRATTAGVVLNR